MLAPLGLERPVVLGLPRGGVPVAYEVAQALDAPLDVLVARKLGAAGNPEFAIGAVAEDGALVLNRETVAALLIGHDELEQAIAAARTQVDERVRRYRGDVERLPLDGCTAIVVDDGLATGATARAALQAVRARAGARRAGGAGRRARAVDPSAPRSSSLPSRGLRTPDLFARRSLQDQRLVPTLDARARQRATGVRRRSLSDASATGAARYTTGCQHRSIGSVNSADAIAPAPSRSACVTRAPSASNRPTNRVLSGTAT